MLRRKADAHLFDLVLCLSDAADLAHPLLGRHHVMVAYVAGRIAETMGLESEDETAAVLGGMLHDIGAVGVTERLDALHFEVGEEQRHSELTYRLLRDFESLAPAAEIARDHHVHWKDGRGASRDGRSVPLGSHILFLADRVCVGLQDDSDVLRLARRIRGRITEYSGRLFRPNVVEAFLDVAQSEAFWLDVTSPQLGSLLRRANRLRTVALDAPTLLGLSRVLSRIIDFRSPFTATHSAGVASTAEELARIAGFSRLEREKMAIAGYLHDLGKLAVPGEILDKPGALDPDEVRTIRRHTYHTYRILETVDGFQPIEEWAAFHHERLDGRGYPFRLSAERLGLGSRVMAVADVFTALTEDRPYRKAMPLPRAMGILESMTGSALDPTVVAGLRDNQVEIDGRRAEAQRRAGESFRRFRADLQAKPAGGRPADEEDAGGGSAGAAHCSLADGPSRLPTAVD